MEEQVVKGIIAKIPNGYFKPSGKKIITSTEEIDVNEFSKAQVVDNNLKPENIAKDVKVLGIVGTHEGGGGIDTSDATASANDLLLGKTAYVDGEKIVGKIQYYTNDKVKVYSYDGTTIATSGKYTPYDLRIELDASLIPSGTLEVTKNGEYDISKYKKVIINLKNYEVIFMNEEGSVELYRQIVISGDNAIDPVTTGIINKPTKESDNYYVYSFSGWSLEPNGLSNENNLNDVTFNRTLYVAFTKETRLYNVNFYNGSTLLQSVKVAYNEEAVYTGDTPIHSTSPDAFEFAGWKPEPKNITSDMNCYAQFKSDGVFVETLNTVMPSAGYYHGAAKGNTIYVFGGGAKTIYKFNIETELLETLNTENLASNKGLSAFLIGDFIYMFGGYSTAIYKFNTVTETIEQLNTVMPTDLYGHSSDIIGTDIYITVGYQYSRNFYKFDTVTETVTTLSTTLPYASGYNAASAAVGTNYYIFGGQASSSSSSYLKNISKLDTLTGTITRLSVKLPNKWYLGKAISVGTYIYIMGGNDGSNWFNNMYRFDTLTETITTLNVTMIGGQYGNVIKAGDSAYIFGAYIGTNINSIQKISNL